MQLLTRLYRAARVHTNLVQPSFKLRSKTRIGARVIKKYHPPVPPAHRVLSHDAVSDEAKASLRRLFEQPGVAFRPISDFGELVHLALARRHREPSPAVRAFVQSALKT